MRGLRWPQNCMHAWPMLTDVTASSKALLLVHGTIEALCSLVVRIELASLIDRLGLDEAASDEAGNGGDWDERSQEEVGGGGKARLGLALHLEVTVEARGSLTTVLLNPQAGLANLFKIFDELQRCLTTDRA